MITLHIPGKPVAKARPRMTRSGHVYTPQKTVDFEKLVAHIAAPHFAAPIEGPVKLTVCATFQPPKSWSKRKVADHLHRPHMQKPDADNLGKAVSDALNGIAYRDDAQAYEVTVRKIWGHQDQTVVYIEDAGARDSAGGFLAPTPTPASPPEQDHRSKL